MNWAATRLLEFGIRFASIAPWFCGMALTVGACEEDPVATLVPMRCGVGSLTEIRVQTRGDVPPGRATSVTVGLEVAALGEFPPGIEAITVEGLFGTQVEAVGRTAVLEFEGELPVYFAPPDSVCGVPAPVAAREIGAIAMTSAGHGLVVGGRDADGRLLDDVVYFSDTLDHAIGGMGRLPSPSTGQTIHAVGPARFVVLGGAGAEGRSSASATWIEVLERGVVAVSEPQPLTFAGAMLEGRAHHAAERLPDGRILMTGGCTAALDGRCDLAGGTVLSGTWLVAASERGRVEVEPGPALQQPRYEHTLLVDPLGVAFVVGGRGPEGVPVGTIEVRLADGEIWAPYGPSIADVLEGGHAIEGATMLEGGLLVLVLSDGTVVWLDEHHRGVLPEWCEGGPCPHDVGVSMVPRRRFPAALPGERIVLDSWLVAPAQLNVTGAHAIDLSVPGWLGAHEPPAPRVGARTLLLRDGSVLLAGGWEPSGASLSEPWLARLRPALDGPDEHVPEIGTLEPGALVLHDPGDGTQARITSSGATLRMTTDEEAPPDELSTWVHVRSFRSQAFRFEVFLTTLADARPRLVFPRGAVARVEIHLDPGGVRYATRDADGSTWSSSCAGPGVSFAGLGERLRIDASLQAVDVYVGDEIIRCPALPPGRVAVGLGAVGRGSLVAQGWRLTR